MRTLFLSSSGLNENTVNVFWKCIKKEPVDTKVIFVPSAAIKNDSAGSMIAAGNYPDGLGYLTNPIIPHATNCTPYGEVPEDGTIELADGQVILIRGEQKEII